MQQIIKVVVDLPLRKLNKEFDYLLPDKFQNSIKIGQIVKVPFGRRKISAFVTQLDVKSDLEKSKLKEIDSIFYSESFFEQKLLDLFYWTAAYYHAYLAQVIKSALPPGIVDQKIKKKEVEYLKLNDQINNYKSELEKLEKRAPKQYLILNYLLEKNNQRNKLETVLAAADTSRQTVYRLIDKDLIILYNKYENRRPIINSNLKSSMNKEITISQTDAELLEQIVDFNSGKNSYLLTTKNSSKRYNFIIKLLEKLAVQQKNIILLIPEIEKDYIFLEQLANYFSDKIAFLHSQLSQAERFDQWQQIRKGEVQIVVGARSAIFAPFSSLDAVILMEENNENYKEQEHPLYHARQIAVKRLKNKKSLLILESPAPSLESKTLADKGEYQQINLAADENKISSEIIDMKKEVERGNLGDLSSKLKAEIKNQLSAGNKVILFLNRLGMSNYIICRKCGHVLKCENCDISLNYHQQEQELRCHYCGLKKEMPQKCPDCGSAFISQAGVGTEKIIEELKKIYSAARIKRVDSDLKEKEVKKRLNDFKNNKIDILVGTSILIKKQFYEELKLIAVISADTALNSSNFRSAETNYFILKELKSLLKNTDQSKFLVQSFQPEHYSIKAALDQTDNSFYEQEGQIRKKRNYPPFCRLLNIIISSQSENKAAAESKKLSNFLDQFKAKYLEKLGEAPAPLSKIRKKYRRQIILKFSSMRNREYIIQLIEKKFIEENNDDSVEIRIDVDPYRML
jgi:primosomal protein N' (replication factor Y)